PGPVGAARRPGQAAHDRRRRHRGAPGHAARLHHRRWVAHRHPGGDPQRRRHRTQLPGRGGQRRHRRQDLSRQLADPRQPGEGRAYAGRSGDRRAAPHRRGLHRQCAALRARPEEDRLMSELHKFIFDGLPVRGMIVRLTDAWTEILARRQANTTTGPWPAPVAELLGEMAAAGALMQSNIKFNGTLVLQIFGDGPVKVAVAEIQHDLHLRATAKVVGDVAADARLPDMVNLGNKGRCAITLDPQDKLPGQQPYQGVVPLYGDRREKLEKLSDILEHYMLQSEQLDTKLVLAATLSSAASTSLVSSCSIPSWCWRPTTRWPRAC